MKTAHQTIPPTQAFSIVDGAMTGCLVSTEELPVPQAVGRTLAEDQISRLDLPPFDKSAMDGYALPTDAAGSFRILETVAAGNVPTAALLPGTTLKVMTGAPVPTGTRRVVKIEDVRVESDRIEVARRDPDSNICLRGEDVRAGDVIMRAGTVLSPLDIASLISCGVTGVQVYRRVRVAVFSTGDEIVDDPAMLAPGKIINSNGPMLAALARQFAMEVVAERTLRDEPELTRRALLEALPGVDIALLTGGVSVGDFDFVTDALPAAGLRVHFTQVSVKPGRPITFATAPGKAIFGLPGNPVSAYLMFHLFVLRAAARLTGAPAPGREVSLTMGFDFSRHKTDRTEYVPCRIGEDGCVEQLEFHGSAHLSALTRADGFFIAPAGCAKIASGQSVRVLILPGVFR
jgi:molybdopterin molybdotransferase